MMMMGKAKSANFIDGTTSAFKFVNLNFPSIIKRVGDNFYSNFLLLIYRNIPL